MESNFTVRMAATSDIQERTISDLPPEVLSHIFSFLPHNIKVVRLVCSKWNDSCNIEQVSGHERIVIDWKRMRPELVNEFFSSKTLSRNIYHLQLDCVSLIDRLEFFEKFGRNIRSLTLKNCSATECIPSLHVCEKLKTLILDRCWPDIVQLFRCSDGSFAQTNIVTLEIKQHSQWSDETMDACICVCPHLRSLSLTKLYLKSPSRPERGFYSFQDGEKRVFNRSDILSFDCIYHALSIRAANIVELDLIFVDGILPEQIEQIASIPNLKLRKLQLVGIGFLRQRNVCNIITSQPDLQYITICHYHGAPMSESAEWIEKCSKLTRLDIRTADLSVFNEKLLNALTSRLHLRELLLIGENTVIGRDFGNYRGTFSHLRELECSFANIDYDSLLEKVSVNLNHLNIGRIGGISSKTLVFISNRFTNLISLVFSMDDREENFSEPISFGSFEKLKTVRIEGRGSQLRSTSSLLRFKAPKLQNLMLRGRFSIDAISLCDMVENYPSLECFETLDVGFKMNPIDLRVIGDWKRLNFFRVNCTEYINLDRRKENEDKFDFVSADAEFWKHV